MRANSVHQANKTNIWCGGVSQVDKIKQALKQHVEEEKAKKYPQFFKAFPGGYGEGDKFLGIRVPHIRKIAKEYKNISFKELTLLISDDYHEVRILALYVLVIQFEKAKNELQRKDVAEFYIKHIKYVNNWDLVDTSAHKILGAYLEDKDKQILMEYATSGNLWLQRIAMIATFWYIRKETYGNALHIAEILVNHSHDLIHKAVGWMLREIGNRDRTTEEIFLKKHYSTMPRTMLRYAIEKFEEPLRQQYLKGTI
ncbi:MAG: DNA alkylation repair protein [Promethearchaeota archaeon]